MPKQIISHSEVECFTKCSRRHYYQYGERLSRKVHSEALQRGIAGHPLILEAFLATLKETGNWAVAMNALDQAFVKSLIAGANPQILNNLLRIIKGWLEHFRDRIERWEIISIEEEKRLDMGLFVFAFTTDLVVIEGGYRTIYDFKFVYDFYRGDLLNLLPQVPRYVGAERALGHSTRYGKYGFVRYRNLKNPSPDDQYQIANIEINNSKIKAAFRDVANAAERIAELKQLPLQEWEQKTTRVYDQWICKACPMKELCSVELNGGNGQLTRLTEYEPSTYGYVAED